MLLEYGVDMGLEEYRRHFIAADGGPEYAVRAYALPITATEVRARKGVLYRALIEPGVEPMPGARAALERLGRARPVAIATNTVRADAAIITAHLGIDALLRAVIVREDYALFQSIPGIGKKTAQRVVLELKEKIAPLAAVEASHLGAGDGHIVARDALVELGYSAAEAEQRLAAIDPDLPPAERVREALRAA